MVLLLFLFGVFFICMAMLWTEGLWSNAISYVNVIIAAMLAINYWEEAATALEEQMPRATYLWDIISVWLLFFLIMGSLRGATAALSKHKVRFHRLMESIGNMAMSVLVASTVTAFAAWTLHMSPLAPAPFRGANLSGFPSSVWGNAMSISSRGSLTGGTQLSYAEYVGKYLQRRQQLDQMEGNLTGP
jgi:hypothetical protein